MLKNKGRYLLGYVIKVVPTLCAGEIIVALQKPAPSDTYMEQREDIDLLRVKVFKPSVGIPALISLWSSLWSYLPGFPLKLRLANSNANAPNVKTNFGVYKVKSLAKLRTSFRSPGCHSISVSGGFSPLS